jgi:hypothetical protein
MTSADVSSLEDFVRCGVYLVTEIYLKGKMFRLNNFISKVINFLETGLIIQLPHLMYQCVIYFISTLWVQLIQAANASVAYTVVSASCAGGRVYTN